MSDLLEKMLRAAGVMDAIGYTNKTKLYDLIKVELVPRGTPLIGSHHAMGWYQSEIAAILAARKANASDDEIRQLVASFNARRPETDSTVKRAEAKRADTSRRGKKSVVVQAAKREALKFAEVQAAKRKAQFTRPKRVRQRKEALTTA